MGRVAFPIYYQQSMMGCGPTCLRMVARYHYDRDYSYEFMQDIAETGQGGSTLLALGQAAERIGLRALGVKVTVQKLAEDAPLPCILHWDSHHYVVLYDIQASSHTRRYHIADPALGRYTLDETAFALHWLASEADEVSLSGIALLLEKASDFKLSLFNIFPTWSKNEA